jgi:aspartyl-tRNA(Asn)/glutamyl-tRNA(Gln) amidotransferase subunit B
MQERAKQNNLIEGSTGPWEVVIGMEVHAQVTSKSKLFSGASTEFGGEPNSHVSLVDAAMPGMLPVINAECIAQAIRTGLGLKAKINLNSVFDRKNYFYPDLPQGYQISQYKSPVVGEGEVIVDLLSGERVIVGIERLHLEQDAGKSLHDQHPKFSFVDLNRSGVALMEIVSKPDLRSADQAKAYLTKLRTIMRYLGTCDGNMEEGSLRADINVSVRKPGAPLGTRCEIKNVNSIRFIGQAIEHEARRQIEVLEDGGTIKQETRLFDARTGETRSMRSKEEAHDYRYFPDPDLLPLELTQDYVNSLAADLPELPDQRRARFIEDFGLSPYDADVLVAEKIRADFFEHLVQEGVFSKQAANWVINVVLSEAKKESMEPTRPTGPELGIATSEGARGPIGPTGPATTTYHSDSVGPEGPTGPTPSGTPEPWWLPLGPTGPSSNAAILKMVEAGRLSSSMAKDLYEELGRYGPTNDPILVVRIADNKGFTQVTDKAQIEEEVDKVIAANPDKAEQAKAKPALAGWFVGQVMKATAGKASPQTVNELVKAKLGIG